MSVLSSCSYASVTRCVIAWARWYSRGLDDRGGERVEELASDLHEQGVHSDAVATPPIRAATSAAGRAVRGVPQDLAWRSAQIRGLPEHARAGFRAWRADRRVGNLTVACGALMTAWCLFVLARIATSVDRGDVAADAPASALMLGFAAVSMCGTLLAARDNTRFIGPLWLLAASQGIIHYGLYALYPSSATVASLTGVLPGWTAGAWALSLALGAFCLAAAVWHFPDQAHRLPPRPAADEGVHR